MGRKFEAQVSASPPRSYCPHTVRAVQCAGGNVMAKKIIPRMWTMKGERELIALSKTHTLEAIADSLRRPPATILQAAKRLGLKGNAKGD
jgi:hypothetical protein